MAVNNEPYRDPTTFTPEERMAFRGYHIADVRGVVDFWSRYLSWESGIESMVGPETEVNEAVFVDLRLTGIRSAKDFATRLNEWRHHTLEARMWVGMKRDVTIKTDEVIYADLVRLARSENVNWKPMRDGKYVAVPLRKMASIKYIYRVLKDTRYRTTNRSTAFAIKDSVGRITSHGIAVTINFRWTAPDQVQLATPTCIEELIELYTSVIAEEPFGGVQIEKPISSDDSEVEKFVSSDDDF